jgi:hypothetical protein
MLTILLSHIVPRCKQIIALFISILMHAFNLFLDHRSFVVLLALNTVLCVEEVTS